MLDIFVRCSDHAPFFNLFNVTLKILGMFNVSLFCHLHSFFARCFYLIVEFFVLRKRKPNKLLTITTLLLEERDISGGVLMILSMTFKRLFFL